MKPDLSTITTGLTDTLESAIKKRFRQVFDTKDAIIAAVTLPKFKLRWVESQETKDRYKQMFFDEMCLLDDDIATIVEEQNVEAKDSYEFHTNDDDDHSASGIESEAMEYFSNAKKLECLQKY